MVGSMKPCKLTYMVLEKWAKGFSGTISSGKRLLHWAGLSIWNLEDMIPPHNISSNKATPPNKCHFLWACGCHSYGDYHKGQVKGWRLLSWLSTLQSMYEALDSYPQYVLHKGWGGRPRTSGSSSATWWVWGHTELSETVSKTQNVQ